MNKERKVIEQNTIVVFEGDVNASKLNELFQDFQGDIVINGNLILESQELHIGCNNLYVMGKIATDHYGDICVFGNLHVESDIDCCDININGCGSCKGAIDSLEINVSEDFNVEGSIFTHGYDINVGGELVCKDEVEAGAIIVFGKITLSDRIQADSISVG